jgi:hypothetical protein
MLFSGACGKMIHEKNLKQKSCNSVLLNTSDYLKKYSTYYTCLEQRTERGLRTFVKSFQVLWNSENRNISIHYSTEQEEFIYFLYMMDIVKQRNKDKNI